METRNKAMVAGVMLLGLPTIERVALLDAPGGKEVVRPLIANRDLQKELKAMSFDKEVFLYEGIPQPAMCEKTKYYRGKYFTLRPRLRADVVTLNLSRNAG